MPLLRRTGRCMSAQPERSSKGLTHPKLREGKTCVLAGRVAVVLLKKQAIPGSVPLVDSADLI